ncbi:MAG: aminotransferase, class, partial [Cyanobacteria bacterium RYN_339]|nr:aminotransferase, class [Cyanobacteria bacterium RYN_339]
VESEDTMNEHMRLMLPGPTPIPPSAQAALSKPMMNHRGPEFGELFRECMAGIRWLYQTEGDVVLFPASSGTGGLEATLVNVLSPGDQVLALVAGEFGARFADMAEAFGAVVTRMSVEYGECFDADFVGKAVAAAPYTAILITHNETSTAVMQPLQQIAAAARLARPEILVLVDAVSSLGVVDLPVDAWDLDVVASGSQKAFMIPPGMASCSVSARAWKAHETAKMARYYWDFSKAKAFEGKGQTPWTPALPLIYALAESLRIMRAEGLEKIFARHEVMTQMLRSGCRAMGLETVVKNESIASRSVTAVFPPTGIDADKMRALVQEAFGLVLAGGQGKLAGKIFRVGHLGFYQPLDMITVLAALEVTLTRMGAQIPLGAGVRAAQEALVNAEAKNGAIVHA